MCAGNSVFFVSVCHRKYGKYCDIIKMISENIKIRIWIRSANDEAQDAVDFRRDICYNYFLAAIVCSADVTVQ